MSSEKQRDIFTRLAAIGAIIVAAAFAIWLGMDVALEPHNQALNLSPLAPEP